MIADSMTLLNNFPLFSRKYERSKQVAFDLRDRVEALTQEKALVLDLLREQEKRYEKMKAHAMAQLDG